MDNDSSTNTLLLVQNAAIYSDTVHVAGTTSLVDNVFVHLESKDIEEVQNLTTNIGFTTNCSETDIDSSMNKKFVDRTSNNAEEK